MRNWSLGVAVTAASAVRGSAHRHSLGRALAALWLDFRTAAHRGARHQHTTTRRNDDEQDEESGRAARPDGGSRGLGVTAGPGLAQGPSPAQLADQGWTCVVPPLAGSGWRCFNPAQGRPPIPPLGEDGRETYTAMVWTPAGEFLGHTHLIRADLYAGQPCPQRAGPTSSTRASATTSASATTRGGSR